MWINKQQWEHQTKNTDDGWKRVANLEGENRVLRDTVKTLEVNLDWFRIRVTQLEKERAQMFHQFTGVKIATPEFRPVVDIPQPPVVSMDMFRDMGDEEATRQGIGWDAQGRVIDMEHPSTPTSGYTLNNAKV